MLPHHWLVQMEIGNGSRRRSTCPVDVPLWPVTNSSLPSKEGGSIKNGTEGLVAPNTDSVDFDLYAG